MAKVTSEFGRLLRYYRRQCTDPDRGGTLTQERLAELLSNRIGREYGRNAVHSWEQGKSRLDHDDRELLVHLIGTLHDCKGLNTINEANQLLEVGNYRKLNDEEAVQLSLAWQDKPISSGQNEYGSIPLTAIPTAEQQIRQPETGLKLPALWPTTLPSTEPYYSLPERDANLENLMSVLQDPKGGRIIAIDGLGGLGKTAIAVELGRRCLTEGLFERIVGESAKQERLVGETMEKIPEALAKLGFEQLLDAIARQLGRWDIPTMQSDEKRATLRYLLQQVPYLIIVDNLENYENSRGLVMELQTLLDGSRVIITSRPRLDLDFVHPLSLSGLSEIDSFVFLQEEAKNRNRPEILNASKQDLSQIHRVTGGAPLAMKLVVGQVSALSLDIVLDNLKRAKGDIYRFIYLESWNMLSLEAQKLLLYMGTVVTTCAYEELANVGIADNEEKLQEAIKSLIGFSLLNSTETVRQKRYGIHSLTRHFVNSDLPDIWREQGLL